MNGTFYTHSVTDITFDIDRHDDGKGVCVFVMKRRMERPNQEHEGVTDTDSDDVTTFMASAKDLAKLIPTLRKAANDIETMLMRTGDLAVPTVKFDPGQHGC